MKTLMIALLVAGLMSTVGVYAASITGSAKTRWWYGIRSG